MNNFGVILLAVIIAIFVAPILAGNLIARLLKLKDTAGRISVVLFALTLGVAPFVWQFIQAKVEASQYEAAMDDWNGKASRTSNGIKPNDTGVMALKAVLPKLEITFDAPSGSVNSEISSKTSTKNE